MANRVQFEVMRFHGIKRILALTVVVTFAANGLSVGAAKVAAPDDVKEFLTKECFDCHSGEDAEAGLALDELGFDLEERSSFRRWVQIHDRIRDGEMPPSDGRPEPIFEVGESLAPMPSGDLSNAKAEARQALRSLAEELRGADAKRVATSGRASMRRLNRLEFENTLRELLDAPWLSVAHLLPEDGVAHLFNKVGEHLDVSHVQLAAYLAASRRSLKLAKDVAAYPRETRKFYAREEPALRSYLHYRFGQTAATRSIVPLLGLSTEPAIIRKEKPVTVGDSDPVLREREAMGVFSGVYSATTKYDFMRIDAPIDGRYRIRFKTYTFRAGPNGASGGDDHGLTGGHRAWWRPDRNVAFVGKRSEPITLYALSSGGDSRWLTTFDSLPEPSVFESVVVLRAGEGIRPDAARLVRTRPGWSGNPNSEADGVPGFAMNWLEVDGPLANEWPPASYKALFADLPFEVANGSVRALPHDEKADANRLLSRFYASVVLRGLDERSMVSADGRPSRVVSDPSDYVKIYEQARSLGENFTDAMIDAMSAMLCSPDFLYFNSAPGMLDDSAFRQRLAYFLLNGPVPRHQASTPLDSNDDEAIEDAVDRMLADPRSERFVNSFLDYWLDLREINANTPDAELYPDYYLDELLTESSLLETRLFFRELIDQNLPVSNLIDSDFVFVNERLANHYGLPEVNGVRLRRIQLPPGTRRGGLLTQASVLRVTANGTTTSPVTRGAWIMERIMGVAIPSPPSGVDAVEPDIRGAKTIREQLDRHREDISCNACHAKFDPVGFALESFDVAGGYRERYRAVGEIGEKVDGIGKNGHAFEFKRGQPVDCSGRLANDETFGDISELKEHLVKEPRTIARNLMHRLIVYATGAPISFGDRVEIERRLDRAAVDAYGVRTIIREVVKSSLFRTK